MPMPYPVHFRLRLRPLLFLVLLLVILTTSACKDNAQVRRHSEASEQQFQHSLLHARRLGLNNLVLQAVLQQAQQLQDLQPPTSVFNDQSLENYYHHLDTGYATLTRQLQVLTSPPTAQIITQTHIVVQQTQASFKVLSTPTLPTNNFRPQLRRLQTLLLHARIAGEYLYVQRFAQALQTALQALPITSARLDSLNSVIVLFQDAHLDTSTLQRSYQADQAAFRQVKSITQAEQLQTRVLAQYQQALTIAVLAAPHIANNRLRTLVTIVQQIPASDTPDPTFQQSLEADREFVASHNSMSFAQLQQFLQQVDTDTSKIQFAVLAQQIKAISQQFHRAVTAWSGRHMYYDHYDGQAYAIDTSYLPSNFGNDADDLVHDAHSIEDLQSALVTAQTLQFNHQLLESDYADPTPYNRVHRTDLLALAHYHAQSGQVIVVSLARQALRLYQNGQLVRAFLVTTGRAERPSPPGFYTILDRLSPTQFISNEAPNSPYWYPPTHINYAMLMRSDGYFLHDSWWRDNYGPGTQFPHFDPAGDEQFAGNGSHGCVNLPTNEAAWLYGVTNWNTTIIVY